ncbi:ATP-binding protein [Burkholderia ubonensis]|uniref:ATP-binding protein n=1 Tax=Burkholderia ubonensis TaxID=101571 RepID=UPI0009B425A6
MLSNLRRPEVSPSTSTCARATGGATGVTFVITDTGIGIARDRIGTIFELFRQADRTISRRFGGTGLGLALCRRLVELMGHDRRAERTGVGQYVSGDVAAALGAWARRMRGERTGGTASRIRVTRCGARAGGR